MQISVVISFVILGCVPYDQILRSFVNILYAAFEGARRLCTVEFRRNSEEFFFKFAAV